MIINDVKIFEPDVHTDYRGELWTLWKKEILDFEFNQNDLRIAPT